MGSTVLPYKSLHSLKTKAVIFDMDGVITNTMPDHYRCWKTVFMGIGIPVTYHDIYRREGQPGILSVREICAEYRIKVNRQQERFLLRKKELLFKKNARLRFIDGSRTFVKRLHRNKFQLALVTGTSRHEMKRILPTSIRQLFNIIITGNDVFHGKPHPEPYLKSLIGLNIKSNQAIVIENAPFGIESAKKAGLRCLALETSLPRQYLKQADAIFSSISDLEQKISFKNISLAN